MVAERGRGGARPVYEGLLSATPGVRVNRLNIYLPLRLTGEYVLDLVGP